MQWRVQNGKTTELSESPKWPSQIESACFTFIEAMGAIRFAVFQYEC